MKSAGTCILVKMPLLLFPSDFSWMTWIKNALRLNCFCTGRGAVSRQGVSYLQLDLESVQLFGGTRCVLWVSAAYRKAED